MINVSGSSGHEVSPLGRAVAIPLCGDASMTVSRNPLVVPQPVSVQPFTPVRDLAPDVRGALLLRFNGEWLLRAQWDRLVAPGDVIEWHEIPQGGNASRTVLQIILVIVAVAFLQPELIPIAIAIGTAVINAVIPIEQPKDASNAMASPGSVYNGGTAANQARLGQPIPVIYGRHKIFPDYSAQPYVEHQDNDQYFYALYTVGQGFYNIPDASIFIDDTQLSHFTDIWYRILQPGQLPSRVHANVVTAPEVAGQPIIGGRYSGSFAACGPRQTATAIGVDVLFDRLGEAKNDGSLGTKTVPVRFEARTIDDFGVATGAWFLLGTRTFEAATTTPQRFSTRYELPTPARVEVRCVRTDEKDDNARVFNDPVWGGMRAYLSTPATLCPTATHFELVMRASEQLSGLSQRKVCMIPRRLLRTWNPTTGFSAPVETRSIAWALLDLWTHPTYGDGLPTSRVDLQTLYELDQVWAARQDRLDIVFDSRITSWDAAKTIAQAGRAMPFRRMGVNTLVRDQAQSLPVTAYTTRNMLPGASIGYSLPTEQTADGIIVEYFDNRAWDWRDVMCPAPGVAVPVNAVRLRIAGITGKTHAHREGLYQAAQNLYRRKFPSWTTELQGMLPAYGSLVVCAPPMASLVSAGDVADWDEATRTLTLTEPADFSGGPAHFVALLRDDGSVTPTIAATPGADEYRVVLAAVPDFDLVVDDPNRERPKYYFGTSAGHRVMTRVLGIRKRGRGSDGAQTIELTGVVEDDRVHSADAHLLPGPGVVQDPVDSDLIAPADGGSAGGSFPIVYLVDAEISANGGGGARARAEFALTNEGRAAFITSTAPTQVLPKQWLRLSPVEISVTSGFDVRATLLPSGGRTEDGPVVDPIPSGSALDVWLNLGTTRSWYVDAADGVGPPAGYANLRIEIRDAASGVVQTTNRINLQALNIVDGGSG